MSEFQHPEVLDWFDRRTFTGPNPGPFTTDASRLADLKREKDLRTSVCLTALNEQTTQIMRATLHRLDQLGRIKLTDELSATLVQFLPEDNGPVAVRIDQGVIERPPMAGVMNRT